MTGTGNDFIRGSRRSVVNILVIRKLEKFLNEMPSEIKYSNDMAVYVPYYIFEYIKDYVEDATNLTVDINKPFELFGTRLFVGYENYFVACIVKFGGVDPKATFKMPIE